MEQFTIFLLGFHVGFIQVLKSPSPMQQLAIFLLGFHLGFYNSKKVKKGKRPTCMKSAEGSLFRQIFRKFDVEHSYPNMYQSHKTLRLRSEMSLLKM